MFDTEKQYQREDDYLPDADRRGDTDTAGCKFVKIFATLGWRISSVCYSRQYDWHPHEGATHHHRDEYGKDDARLQLVELHGSRESGAETESRYSVGRTRSASATSVPSTQPMGKEMASHMMT